MSWVKPRAKEAKKTEEKEERIGWGKVKSRFLGNHEHSSDEEDDDDNDEDGRTRANSGSVKSGHVGWAIKSLFGEIYCLSGRLKEIHFYLLIGLC